MTKIHVFLTRLNSFFLSPFLPCVSSFSSSFFNTVNKSYILFHPTPPSILVWFCWLETAFLWTIHFCKICYQTLKWVAQKSLRVISLEIFFSQINMQNFMDIDFWRLLFVPRFPWTPLAEVWKFSQALLRFAWVLSHFSRVRLFATPWTVVCKAPLSMGFSRQEYWSGLPCPPPGDLPDPGIEPASLASPALQVDFCQATWEAHLRLLLVK